MKNKKKIYTLIILVILMSLFTNMTAFAHSTKHKIKVTVNNKTVKYEVSPYLTKGEVMIPLEETAKALGAKVEWDKRNATSWIHLDQLHAELIVGKSEMYIHRDADFSGIPQTVKLNTAIKSSHGSVMVPGKAVFESIGWKVSWDNKKRELSITAEKNNNKNIKYTEIGMESISKIRVVNSWYDKNYKKAGIHSIRNNGTMYVIVSAGKKPTGGYSVGINSIAYESATKAFVDGYVKAPSPDTMVTQVETYPHILVKIEGQKKLRSVRGKVSESTSNPLPTVVSYEEITYDSILNNSGLANWYTKYNQQQGIHYMRDGEYLYALIAAGERSTGGYTVNIEDIYYSSADTVVLRAKVTPPGANDPVIMMITYPNMLIRIKSASLKAILGDIYETGITGVTLDKSTVKTMELYDLNQVKIRDLLDKEKDEVIQAFHRSTIDPNPHIEMITGKLLKVTTTDGYIMTFTSYGSDKNVIAGIQKDSVTKSYHLHAPGIAKYIYK